MRQLLARIDDDVHARLKEIAAAEGRSLNSLVAEVLSATAREGSTRETVTERARATGRLRTRPRPDHAPSYEDVRAATRGWGTTVSDALLAEREAR